MGLLVSGVAVVYLANAADFAATGQLLARADPRVIVAAVVVLAAGLLLRVARWRLLLPVGDTVGRVPVRRLLGPVLIGYLANILLPARLGEGVRAASVWRRERIGLPETIGSVAVERVLDTVIVAVLGFAAVAWLQAPGWLLTGMAVVAAISGGIVAVLLSGVGSKLVTRMRRLPRLAAPIGRFLKAASVADRRALRAAIALSAVAWLLDGVIVWFGAAALSVPLEPAEAMAIAAVAVLGTAIPAAPGYVGTYELAASTAGTALGLPPETALAVAILVHAVTYVSLAVAGLVAAMTMGPGLAADLQRVVRRGSEDTEDTGYSTRR